MGNSAIRNASLSGGGRTTHIAAPLSPCRRRLPLFGISKSAADRALDHLGPLLAISPARRKREDTVYIVDGTLVPTRDRTVASSSKNYRYSTNLQVVIDANSRLVVAIGDPLPGSRNDCRAFTESDVDVACPGVP